MKIKYIKDAPNGPAGMTDDVSDFHANILILTGIAELDNTIYFDDQSQFTLVTESRSLINPKQVFEPTEPKPKTRSKAKATTKTDNE